MNIEESIKEMKSLSPSEEAIETLLTAYEKEKEKNKKYNIKMTDEQYSKVIDLVEFDVNKKWQDKIKAKIEEVSNGTYDAKIVLQLLLEKE